MGAASIAKRLMIPAIKQLQDHFELVAIASRDAEKAKLFGDLFQTTPVTGYGTLLEDPTIDVIYMPLPTGLHEEWITKSLLAGKHVLVEKSLAMSGTSAKRMIDLAKLKGLALMENFMFKYHSQHDWVWNLIKNDKIGSIRLFRSQFGFPPLDKSSFRYKKNDGGGSVLDAAAYTVKASQWFLKGELSVMAATLYMDHNDVDIFGNATLINKEGLVSQISFGFDNFYQCNYELWGSNGRIMAERAFTPKPTESPVIVWEQQGKIERKELNPDNHFMNLLMTFHNVIIEKKWDALLHEIQEQSNVLTEIFEKAKRISI